ncbi:unnamed protein product [Caenorhabditis angaria]|uniref:Uncharacterized protein n=1 Tax=Caenorhabditis angaria TaxID=860376 RepID=A0A9P1IJ95_9PELO|nr:unnamed protein product [Caenorhabditis angaria]CAI5445116.1 unnamed protein product [Caenorhabditis angaria]
MNGDMLWIICSKMPQINQCAIQMMQVHISDKENNFSTRFMRKRHRFARSFDRNDEEVGFFWSKIVICH